MSRFVARGKQPNKGGLVIAPAMTHTATIINPASRLLLRRRLYISGCVTARYLEQGISIMTRKFRAILPLYVLNRRKVHAAEYFARHRNNRKTMAC